MAKHSFRRLGVCLAVMGFALAVAACSSSGPTAGGAGAGATSGPGGASNAPVNSTAATLDMSGNTSSIPVAVANALGCANFSANPQMDDWVAGEATCLFAGDNEVTIFSFTSANNEQKWFDLGPESADESGTVVRGDVWAVEPFNESQAPAIQQIVGGTIEQQQ